MKRILAAILLVLALVGGFIALNPGFLDSFGEEEEKEDVNLSIKEASQVPSYAPVVNSTHDQIDDVEPIQRGLRDADNGSDHGSRLISGNTVDEVESALSSLPQTRQENVLIRYNNTVYRVDLYYLD